MMCPPLSTDVPIIFSLMFLLASSSKSKSLLYFYLLSSSLISTVFSWTMSNGDIYFGKFLISSNHIFYKSPQGSAAFVNLRPIVKGHVLVIPERQVRTLQELTDDEYIDMWMAVRHVQTALQHHYQDDESSEATPLAFNVAVQDGRAAGQSVPHVHVHILPRQEGDFERSDDVYDALEAWAPREDMKKEVPKLQVVEDEDRVDRTPEIMAQEAALYRSILESSSSKL